MAAFWRRNRLLVLAFAIVLGLAVFFGVGAIRKARDFDVAKEQPIAAWMTPRFVSHSWDVPREAMMDILRLEEGGRGRVTLEELAEEKGLTVEAYIGEIEAGIAAFRAAQGK
ncbi:MAG: hypothetical protein LJE62_05875 [Silicimonas sp.]|jgi:hypothetical protein|nr:hypothetical protein [Silicimonas sp.]